jgi:hypothetical protein
LESYSVLCTRLAASIKFKAQAPNILVFRATFFPAPSQPTHVPAAMGDSAFHDIKQLLQDVLSKVAVLEGKMVTVEDGMKAVGTKVSAVDGEIAAVKADQGRLHVAINTVQSKQIEAVATSGTFARDTPASSIGGAVLNAASHKLRFLKYDGSGDPLPWLHRCDQFFRAARTAEVEKVWLAAFYMEGIAQQWYYRSNATAWTTIKATRRGLNSANLLISGLALQHAATRLVSCAIFAVLDRSTTIRPSSSPCSLVVAACRSHNRLPSSQRASGIRYASTSSFRSR